MSTQVEDFLDENAIFDFSVDYYRDLCEQLAPLLRQQKELESKCKKLREQVLTHAGGDRMEYGIKVTKRERAGAVDLKKLVEDGVISQEILETYRKEPTEFYEVRNY